MHITLTITINDVTDTKTAEPYLNDIRDILDEMKDNADCADTKLEINEEV